MTWAWPFSHPELRDLLKVIEDRHGSSSTLIAITPIENWHDDIGYPTIARRILDRLVIILTEFNSKEDR